jgi:hypothetical protein
LFDGAFPALLVGDFGGKRELKIHFFGFKYILKF